MSIDSTNLEAFLPLSNTFPEKWEEARPLLTEHFNKISNAINVRKIGRYVQEQYPTGELLYPGASGEYRTVFLKVVQFGSLPNSTTKSVPHGISYTNSFRLVCLYATSDFIGNSSLTIPYASPDDNKEIEINIDTTNINITTAMNYSNYTNTDVKIYYVLEG
jgi:hypothetical protein